MCHLSLGATLKEDRDVLLLQLMSLPFVCETDVTCTKSLAQLPSSPKPEVESADPASVHPVIRDTEVLLLGLKPGTQYKATVDCGAPDGTSLLPATNFSTCMLDFAKWLQPEFLAQSCVFCDSCSELSLASQLVLLSEGDFWKRFWTE